MGKRGAGAEVALEALSSPGGKPLRGRHAWNSGRARGAWDLLRYWGHQAQLGVALPGGAGAPSLLGGVQNTKGKGPLATSPLPTHSRSLLHTLSRAHTTQTSHTHILSNTPPPFSQLGHPYALTHSLYTYTLTLSRLHTLIHTHIHTRRHTAPSHIFITCPRGCWRSWFLSF